MSASLPGRSAWLPVLEQIEAALAEILARTSPPPEAPQDAPPSSAASLPLSVEERLQALAACLEQAERQTADADARLAEASVALRAWCQSADAQRTRLSGGAL